MYSPWPVPQSLTEIYYPILSGVLCFVFCYALLIVSLLLVIMGGQHDGVFLSGSLPIVSYDTNIYFFRGKQTLLLLLLLLLLFTTALHQITHNCTQLWTRVIFHCLSLRHLVNAYEVEAGTV